MATKSKKSNESKIIKHAPASRYKYSETQTVFKLKQKSPFMSSVKQISKMIKRVRSQRVTSTITNRGSNISRTNYITVIGLQRVVPKLLQIGVYFQEKGHKVELKTKTVTLLDEVQINEDKMENDKEYEEDDDDKESVFQKRSASGVELRVYSV